MGTLFKFQQRITRKGDVVIVKQGEMIPSDGEVIKGLASVDESAITGESGSCNKRSWR